MRHDTAYEFGIECERKEKLFHLFNRIESAEREEKIRRKLPYERVFHDWATIREVRATYLALEAQNGQMVAPVMIDAEIARLLKIGDGLFIKAGLRNGEWHVIFIESIGSSLSG